MSERIEEEIDTEISDENSMLLKIHCCHRGTAPSKSNCHNKRHSPFPLQNLLVDVTLSIHSHSAMHEYSSLKNGECSGGSPGHGEEK